MKLWSLSSKLPFFTVENTYFLCYLEVEMLGEASRQEGEEKTRSTLCSSYSFQSRSAPLIPSGCSKLLLQQKLVPVFQHPQKQPHHMSRATSPCLSGLNLSFVETSAKLFSFNNSNFFTFAPAPGEIPQSYLIPHPPFLSSVLHNMTNNSYSILSV